ncbi:hypothetical protein DFH27DRAFT_522248 [Peziza echinospora]|nr:hypothetical protein DFH27DRAFT_522248 [Peziza echinospora]
MDPGTPQIEVVLAQDAHPPVPQLNELKPPSPPQETGRSSPDNLGQEHEIAEARNTNFKGNTREVLQSQLPLAGNLDSQIESSTELIHNTDRFHARLREPTPLKTAESPAFKSQSHARNASDSLVQYLETDTVKTTAQPRRASMMSASPTAPSIITLDIPQRNFSVSSTESYDSISKAPKSPATNRFTSFFRWQSGSTQEPTTPVSARAPSPSLSPKTLGPSFKSGPPMTIDTLRANAAHNSLFLADSGLSLAPPTPGMGSYDSVEEELRLVSAELALSIKREMELEDLVEKLESDISNASGGNREKRTSDYFSDAGTPIRNVETSSYTEQDLEKTKRNHEQEKATIRLEMLGKISEERQRRVEVESQMRQLEDQVSRGEYSQLVSTDTGRITNLSNELADTRRKLSVEKQARENFEALVTAMKEQLREQGEERDRLRDIVVPQLTAKVRGLEAETSQMQQILNDKARLQQELAAIRTENLAILSVRKPLDAQATTPIQKRMSLAQMTGLSTTGLLPYTPSLASPLSPKEKETLADKLKDVEAQRDELHKALRSLRQRQQFESRQSKLKIKALEQERDRALRDSPRRFGNTREVSLLRREVDRLRQRAEEALEAKFVCERNLGSLKMDLERAEQETATLKVLLHEHDALVNQHAELKDSHFRLSKQMSQMKYDKSESQSVSLQRAYMDLQRTHELTLNRLDHLESKGNDISDDFEERKKKLVAVHEESEEAMNRLRQSLAEAEARQETSQMEADAYKKRASALQNAEKEHIHEEKVLALQLRDSTERVAQLAEQVQMQIQSNASLRERLAAAIDRGEEEQHTSATRINDLQNKLKNLEDKVLAAQQETEDTISHHEDEIRLMKENHSSQLTRLKSTFMKNGPTSPRMPLTPLLKSPRLEWTNKLGVTVDNQGNSSERVEFLEKRVTDLEKALSEADKEMEEVVNRMSMAQIEVMELTSQRDEATRLTKKLQSDITYEKQKFAELLGI